MRNYFLFYFQFVFLIGFGQEFSIFHENGKVAEIINVQGNQTQVQPILNVGLQTNFPKVDASNRVDNKFFFFHEEIKVESRVNSTLIPDTDSINYFLYVVENEAITKTKNITSLFKPKLGFQPFLYQTPNKELIVLRTTTIEIDTHITDLPIIFYFDQNLELEKADTLFFNNYGISLYISSLMGNGHDLFFTGSYYDGSWKNSLYNYSLDSGKIILQKDIPKLANVNHPTFKIANSDSGIFHSQGRAFTFSLSDLTTNQISSYKGLTFDLLHSKGSALEDKFFYYAVFSKIVNINAHTDSIVRIEIDLEKDSIISEETIDNSSTYKQLGTETFYFDSISKEEIIVYTKNAPIDFFDDKDSLELGFFELNSEIRCFKRDANGNLFNRLILKDLGRVEPKKLLKTESGFAFIGLYWDFINYPNKYKKQPFILFLNHEGEMLSVQPLSATQNTLSVFPNPAQNQVFLSKPLHNIQVVDVQGKLVQSASETLINKLDVQSLQTGMYVLTGQTEEGKTVNTRFLKR